MFTRMKMKESAWNDGKNTRKSHSLLKMHWISIQINVQIRINQNLKLDIRISDIQQPVTRPRIFFRRFVTRRLNFLKFRFRLLSEGFYDF